MSLMETGKFRDESRSFGDGFADGWIMSAWRSKRETTYVVACLSFVFLDADDTGWVVVCRHYH